MLYWEIVSFCILYVNWFKYKYMSGNNYGRMLCNEIELYVDVGFLGELIFFLCYIKELLVFEYCMGVVVSIINGWKGWLWGEVGDYYDLFVKWVG